MKLATCGSKPFCGTAWREAGEWIGSMTATGKNPRVSIGLPVYNGERFLGLAIESLLAQTFRDFELIVCDNASTDRTREIVESYATRDSRVRVLSNPRNIGLANNMNRTVAESKGDYFQWAAHDDLWDPRYLERCVTALDEDPGAVLACVNTRDIDEEGKFLAAGNEYRAGTVSVNGLATQPIAHERFYDMIGLEHVCEPIFALMRGSVLRKTPLHGRYADADRVLLAEMSLHGRFQVLPEALFYHREHTHRSVHVHPGRHERSVMMDPANEGKILFPHFKELWEFLKAVGRSPVAFGERLRCYRYLFGWASRYWRRLWMDLKIAAILIARRVLPLSVRNTIKSMISKQA